MSFDEAFLQELTLLANETAYSALGHRDSCILTSNALCHVLASMGGEPKLTRVTCAVFPEDRKYYGTVLGGQGDGTFRPASAPGMWKGHLVVTLGEWLLDATLDQANKPEWPEEIRVHPIAVRLNKEFWDGRTMFFKCGTTMFRYSLYPKQIGFANAPNARASHWRPVANLMLGKFNGSLINCNRGDLKWQLTEVDIDQGVASPPE